MKLGSHILSAVVLGTCTAVHGERFPSVTLQDMQFCPHLDGAKLRLTPSFDAYLQKHIPQYHSQKPSGAISQFVDSAAKHLYAKDLSEAYLGPIRNMERDPKTWFHRRKIDPAEAHRFSCYAAAHGANSFVKYTKDPLLVGIRPRTYFAKERWYDRKPKELRASPKSTCKIGFLVMSTSFTHNLKHLVKELRHPNVRILVNIDPKFPKQRRDFETWLGQQSPGAASIQLMDPAAGIFWGHSSMVFTQQRGFFQLLDEHRCEFYVNLSDMHYPLASVEQMYKTLTEAGMDTSWFGNTFGHNRLALALDLARRLRGPPVLKSISSANAPAFSGMIALSRSSPGKWAMNGISMRTIPYPFREPVVKADQWMVLSRTFVEKMRTSLYANMVLASMEWMSIPDELYYQTVARVIMPSDTIRLQATTYVHWSLTGLPRVWDLEKDAATLLKIQQDGFLFTRKVPLDKLTKAGENVMEQLKMRQ